MTQWHYSMNGEATGPVGEDEIRALIAAGTLGADDYLWREGLGAWVTVASVPQFAPADATAPSMAPPAAPSGASRSHDIDYRIIGDDLQAVEVELDPGETVIAEAGAMNYMDDGIAFEARFGDGSKPDQGFWGKLVDGGKRMLTGEGLFLTHFTNSGGGKRTVAMAAPYPGKIIPLHLDQLGGDVLCQKDAFLCAAMGTEVGIAFSKKLGAGLFGGEGFILQRLRGDGMAFLHAGGSVVQRRLEGGRLLCDTGCLVGFTSGVDYDIQAAGGLKSMLFGGEGIFLATLQGTGTVWLQTLPFARLVHRISAMTGGRSRQNRSSGISLFEE